MDGGINRSWVPFERTLHAVIPGVPGVPFIPGLPGLPLGPANPSRKRTYVLIAVSDSVSIVARNDGQWVILMKNQCSVDNKDTLNYKRLLWKLCVPATVS